MDYKKDENSRKPKMFSFSSLLKETLKRDDEEEDQTKKNNKAKIIKINQNKKK